MPADLAQRQGALDHGKAFENTGYLAERFQVFVGFTDHGGGDLSICSALRHLEPATMAMQAWRGLGRLLRFGPYPTNVPFKEKMFRIPGD
jgi:hypothetical protein